MYALADKYWEFLVLNISGNSKFTYSPLNWDDWRGAIFQWVLVSAVFIWNVKTWLKKFSSFDVNSDLTFTRKVSGIIRVKEVGSDHVRVDHDQHVFWLVSFLILVLRFGQNGHHLFGHMIWRLLWIVLKGRNVFPLHLTLDVLVANSQLLHTSLVFQVRLFVELRRYFQPGLQNIRTIIIENTFQSFLICIILFEIKSF